MLFIDPITFHPHFGGFSVVNTINASVSFVILVAVDFDVMLINGFFFLFKSWKSSDDDDNISLLFFLFFLLAVDSDVIFINGFFFLFKSQKSSDDDDNISWFFSLVFLFFLLLNMCPSDDADDTE